MAKRIGIVELSGLLAIKSGLKTETCENFIRSIVNLLSKGLIGGEEVDFPGLGIFKTVKVDSRKSINIATGEEIEIPAHLKIVFSPTKNLSSLINSPFESFETVELYEEDNELVEGNENLMTESRMDWESDEEGLDDLTTKEAYDELNKGTNNPIPNISNKNSRAESNLDANVRQPEEINLETESQTTEKQEKNIPPVLADNSLNYDLQNQTNLQEDIAEIEDKTGTRFKFGFFWGALCMLLICGTVFLIGFYNRWFDYPQNKEAMGSELETFVLSDEKMESNNEISDYDIANNKLEPKEGLEEEGDNKISSFPEESEEIYDTVSPTRYLAYIAQDHYGNFNFWPYIYEENKDILGHPDRIKPGTRVKVPDLKKYGVNPGNKSDIEKAKKKGVEIYMRYK